MDAPEQIVELVRFAFQNQHDMGEDMLSYVQSEVMEILLGLTEEEAVEAA